jgi:hypothetical protein
MEENRKMRKQGAYQASGRQHGGSAGPDPVCSRDLILPSLVSLRHRRDETYRGPERRHPQHSMGVLARQAATGPVIGNPRKVAPPLPWANREAVLRRDAAIRAIREETQRARTITGPRQEGGADDSREAIHTRMEGE